MNSRFTSLSALFAILATFAASAQQKATNSTAPQAAHGADSQTYRNPLFGFRYHIPYGWVDRTKEMQEQDIREGDNRAPESGKDQGTKTEAHKASAGAGEVLLAVFERPPEATGDTVNS